MDRASLTVERDRDVGIGADLRDRLAGEHRQVLALEGERVGHLAREPNRTPWSHRSIQPAPASCDAVIMTDARSHVASSGRNTSAVASVSQNEYPGPVKMGSFARMIVCAARASGLAACSARASTKNVVNGTSSVASSGTRVTGMPSITSLAASGSTHTLYSATPLGVLPATSIAPAIETTAGTRDANPGPFGALRRRW